MSKVIVSLGYRSVVLDADKALALIGMLDDAELYEVQVPQRSRWQAVIQHASHIPNDAGPFVHYADGD
jgi:hypothetical protein